MGMIIIDERPWECLSDEEKKEREESMRKWEEANPEYVKELLKDAERYKKEQGWE